MNHLKRFWLMPLLLMLVLSAVSVWAADTEEAWQPTPPRLSFIDGEVSYWRPGADDWSLARINLALTEGDALYTGNDANFEVQFGSRSFVRADENSQLSLVEQDEHRIQFKLSSGRVSFDMRGITAGDRVEVSTPDAVFVIEHPGYYRVEVGSRDTHFITRRGGEATVTTADGRTMAIYPSEEIVVSAGNPATVATYAAAEPDAWDRWNDERSDRIGESASARYLPPDVYGAEELDHYGHWRDVPSYGSVWIPYGVSADWVPYSTGSWVWDPHYEWTWIDDAPWGWAPFHYGRWVYIDGFWAWTPGPVVRRPVYCPALVAFMIHGHDVSARISVGLPGLWWVALSWGEPVLPWWGRPGYRGHPHWAGWGGPRIVNNVVIRQTAVINAGNIHFHNASLPHAILTVPADKFGRERIRATVERRYRGSEFAPVLGDLPVKPSRASLFGGAPRGTPPPRDVVSRPVVSTRVPRERVPAFRSEAPRAHTQVVPESRYVIPPVRHAQDLRSLPRPPRGAEAGPERAPLPLPPRYGEVKKVLPAPPPVTPRSPAAARERERRESGALRSQVPSPREQGGERREVRPAMPGAAPPAAGNRPSVPGSVQAPRARSESLPARVQTPAPAPAPAPPSRQPAAGGVQSPRVRTDAMPERVPIPPRPPAMGAPPGSAGRPPAPDNAPSLRVRPEPAPGRVQPPSPPPVMAAPPAPAGLPAPGGAQTPRMRDGFAAPRSEVRQERNERALPGQPANQTFRGHDRENRDAR